MASSIHNLDIKSYSLRELLSLFDMTTLTPSLDEMRRAKKKMLMTHPDQSKLPSKYYLFYRQAYEIVLKFYQEQTRQNQSTDNVGDYVAPGADESDGVKSVLDKMSSRDFHSKFNQLFDQMDMGFKPDPTRNAWFTHGEPVIPNVPDRVAPKDMAQAFHAVKAKTASALTQYRGVQDMMVAQGTASLYGDDDPDDPASGTSSSAAATSYISSDVFSKLKYDDLRKVHKDQTVLAVSEADYDRMPKYRSVEHYSRERDAAPTTPLSEHEANRILQDKLRREREQIMHREYQAMQKEKENEKKNQAVMSQFLLLTTPHPQRR